jgi:transcriptional regulator with XRE-family HTH domain
MTHPVDTYVGKKLWLRRKMLGMSQEAVANEVGITFQQVQKYERGVNRMSASRLFDFARVLTVPITYFFEGFESADKDYTTPLGGAAALAEPKSRFSLEEFTSPETIELLKNYSMLSPAVRKKVNEMVKALAADKPTL